MIRATRLALLLLLGACTGITTDIAAVRAPEFASNDYSKVCVSAPDADIRLATGTEAALADGLRARGVAAIRLGDLLFVGKPHEEAEIAAKVRESGADAFLVLKPVSSSTEERWIPPSITTTTDYGRRSRPWGWGYSTTWVSGGYSVSMPRATLEARLFDVASEQVVWVASVEASGNASANWLDLRTAAAAKVVERLDADHLLRNRAE
ncbi:MAG: hypothetical protein U1F36_16415 [Planctomycetota bacterium]